MIDLLSDAMRAASHRAPMAYPLLAAAGAASAVGPCTAPRILALAALAHGAARPARTVLAFVAGTAFAYVVLAAAAGAIASLWTASPFAYALLAVVLSVAGVATLVRAGAVRCTAVAHAPPATSGAGGALLLGASTVLVVSPCCTPAIGAIGALAFASGRAVDGVAFAATFACGHALPLVVAGAAGGRAAALTRRMATAQAPAIIAGTLMLALGAFYAVLA